MGKGIRAGEITSRFLSNAQSAGGAGVSTVTLEKQGNIYLTSLAASALGMPTGQGGRKLVNYYRCC